MKASYKKGILVWVDDNFLEHEFLNENSEIDKWQAIFGSYSKKVYRLLNLELKIMTNKQDFENYLLSIENTLDTYYYFIVDLSLPEYIGAEPEVINGLEIGVALQEKMHDFCFLSSSSSAGAEMQEMGLSSHDYYVKFNNNDLLPESLRHKILFSFRNNISWVELHDLKDSLNPNSNILLPKKSDTLNEQDIVMAISSFPYFDKFRDFLDRTEYEANIFNKPFFIRSHPDNSYEFESQALLIMLADKIFMNPGKISIEYDKYTNNNFRIKIENSSDNIFWAVKLNKDIKVAEFEEFYKKVKRKQIVFIIDDNESAEKFLEHVNHEHTSLKDFPFIKENDLELRDELIAKSIQLFLNHFYKIDNKIHSLYLEHPSLLIHPKNMMFLNNPRLMTSDLTDPPEILSSLFEGFKLFFNTPNNKQQREAITQGYPIKADSLFRASNNILSKSEHIDISHKALIYALDNWLKSSWKFPYGLELSDNRWKEHSFKILLMLIEEFNSVKDDISCKELSPYISSIELTSELLSSPAIKKIINSQKDDISTSEWEELAYLRWPHLKYPMPMYLNELLEKSDKHLWIQHKNFNFVGYSKTLILEHRKLNNMLEYYDKTLTLMKKTYHFFPQEMQAMFEFIIDGVEKKKNYQQSALKDELFTPLTNFMDEFLTIGILFRSTYGSTNRNKSGEIKKIKETIKVAGNYGKAVGIIDGTLKKEKPFSFKLAKYAEEEVLIKHFRERLNSYISKGYFTEDHFLEKMDTLLTQNNITTTVDLGNSMIESDILQPIVEDPHWVKLNFKEQEELIKNSSIVDHIRAIFSQFEYFNLHFNIIKNIDSSVLLQYLSSIRNKVIAHKDATENKNVDLEYLYESFIYSYESILLQYQYVLSQIKSDSPIVKDFLSVQTNYVQLKEHGLQNFRKFKVSLTNKHSKIELTSVTAAEIESLYCDKVTLTQTSLELENISLNNLEKLKVQYKIREEDIKIIDLLDLNVFAKINVNEENCDQETSLSNDCIKIEIDTKWLK